MKHNLSLLVFSILFVLLQSVSFGQKRNIAAIMDFDGDGKTDPAIYRYGSADAPNASSATIGIALLSSTNYTQRRQSFLTNESLNAICTGVAPADFDGDGKTDMATFRSDNTAGIHIYRHYLSSLGGTVVSTFAIGDYSLKSPFPQDYDGDGKDDYAVMQRQSPYGGNWETAPPSTWRIRRSSDFRIQEENFGTTADIKIKGDFDGDGKADLAFYRQTLNQTDLSKFVIKQSTTGQIKEVFLGKVNGTPFSGDFDGDGKSDVAIVSTRFLGKGRNAHINVWEWIQSSDNSYHTDRIIIHSKQDLAYAIYGDFDGDGKTDLGYYLKKYVVCYGTVTEDINAYYIKKSSNGETLFFKLGGQQPRDHSQDFYDYPLTIQYSTPFSTASVLTPVKRTSCRPFPY